MSLKTGHGVKPGLIEVETAVLMVLEVVVDDDVIVVLKSSEVVDVMISEVLVLLSVEEIADVDEVESGGGQRESKIASSRTSRTY